MKLFQKISAIAGLLIWVGLIPAGHADVLEKQLTAEGMTISYKVVLPDGFSADQTYRGVLAFPGGGQSMERVENDLATNWQGQAEARGFIVVMPAAVPDMHFFRGGDVVFPELLDDVLGAYKIKGGKFHIAGISNGGRSAFHIAALYPEYFLSVTGLPGLLPNATDEGLAALGGLCMAMYVGSEDVRWHDAMKVQYEALHMKGASISFTVEPGEGHVMKTLAGDGAKRLYDFFEASQNGCAS